MGESLKIYGRPWPDPERGPWLIRLRFAVVNDTRECVGMEIRSVRLPGESASSRVPNVGTRLTGTVLRDLPLSGLINEWRELQAMMLRSEALRGEHAARKQALKAAAEWGQAGNRRGRPSKGVEFYADVAKAYREAASAGESPILAVRQWHRRHHGPADQLPTKSAAAKWVYRARKLALLSPAGAQKEGGLR